MRFAALASVGTLALVASISTPRPAVACGGCFAPGGSAQVVTDHRMVLSLSSTQTTLWDQFRYSGSPSEFSWILPIANGPQVQIHLADDRFMTILDNLSVPVLYAPQRPYPYCEYPPYAAFADAAAAADASADTGVTIYQQEVVGPYDVAVIGGTDPMAIRNWLGTNGYVVTPNVSPIIDWYTSRHMDFLALRLHPGEGVDRMSPVRITVPGYAPTLPLRMISAGVADKVGIVLLVIADGRIETANFPNGEVQESDLTYDFDNPTVPSQDFLAAEDRINRSGGGRVWIAESVMDQDADSLGFFAMNSRNVLPRDGGIPTCDPNDAGTSDGGMAADCTDPVQDMDVALAGLGASVRITRLRADLAGTMLDQDLMLQPSTGGLRNRTYSYGHVLNTPPPPPPCDGGSWGGTDSGRPPAGTVSGGGCSGHCSAGRTPSRGGAIAIALFVALAVIRSRRKRES